MNALRERLTVVETVVGEDSRSGLRSEVADLRDKFDKLIERIGNSEKRIAMIVGGIVVASRALEMLLNK